MSLDWTIIGPALTIVGLLLLSAFFSGSETSLTATSRARMLQLERDKDPAAARLDPARQ
jgi:Mg2+/Co2+ transporter CorB